MSRRPVDVLTAAVLLGILAAVIAGCAALGPAKPRSVEIEAAPLTQIVLGLHDTATGLYQAAKLVCATTKAPSAALQDLCRRLDPAKDAWLAVRDRALMAVANTPDRQIVDPAVVQTLVGGLGGLADLALKIAPLAGALAL